MGCDAGNTLREIRESTDSAIINSGMELLFRSRRLIVHDNADWGLTDDGDHNGGSTQ